MRKPKSSTLARLIQLLHQAQAPEVNQASRRKFIKDVSKTGAFIGLSSLIPLSACNSGKKAKDARIAIIGAGLAGLNCAYTLQKLGIKASIYEADKRAGGRVLSKKDIMGPGFVTEFGAEFIDTDHKEMHALVKEFGFELIDVEQDKLKNPDLIVNSYFIDGKHYSEEDVLAEFKKIIPQLESDRLICGENYDTEAAKAFDLTSLETYLRGFQCATWLQDMLIAAYVGEYGLDADNQSSLNFLSFVGLDSEKFKAFGDSDERYKVVGGNQRIPDALYDKVKDQVRFSYTLASVVQEADNTYTLTFGNAEVITVDYVVLCIPFTILRNVKLDLKEMPDKKLACIQQLSYGQNSKLFLALQSRPWRLANPSRAGYLFHKRIFNGWDNTHMQSNNEGAGAYTVFLGGRDSLKVATAASAAGLRDRIPEDIVADYLNELDQVFPGSKAAYANVNAAAFWPNNPNMKGSYVCYTVGQWSSIAGWEGKPVGNVLFAGSHCSSDYQGFMNGAAETGRQAAEELAKRLGL